RFTPLADALVADAVDGAVGPFGGSARERLGVDVAGSGVEGERGEAGPGAVDILLQFDGAGVQTPFRQLPLTNANPERTPLCLSKVTTEALDFPKTRNYTATSIIRRGTTTIFGTICRILPARRPTV